MKPEAFKQKAPQYHFSPEIQLSSSDDEFLDALLENLKGHGLDPKELIFSGFDGTDIAKGQGLPRYPYIFAMNEVGWRKANKNMVENPAVYAEGWATPCIGLYDRKQLVHVYSSDINLETEDDLQEIVDSRVELTNIVLGHPLSELPPDIPIEEAVVHKDYPDGSPTDALLGVVFIES